LKMTTQEIVANITGKTFLIVGGTKGIGLALAKALSKNGGVVTALGRTKTRELEELNQVTFVKVDLSLMKAARDVVGNELKGKTFDSVIYSVGIITSNKLTRTAEGVEEDLAISYLCRFVMMKELMAQHMLVGRKRVYVFGYPGEKTTPIANADDINFDNPALYSQMPAHMNTVAFNEGFVHEIARRYPDLKVFGLNPGLIRTGIRDNVHGGESSWLGWIIESLIGLFTKTPDQYVESYCLYLVASPDVAHMSPVSFSNKGVTLKPLAWNAEEKNRIKAWEASETLVNRILQE